MAIKPDSKSKIDIGKWNTVWAMVIAACTLLGIGFSVGIYVANTLTKMEYHDDIQKLNNEISNQKIVYEKQITKITHEKNLLEIENGKLKK